MKAMLRRLVMALLVLGCGQVASAQTADEIVDKVLNAMGGRAAIGKLTSRSTVGTMTLSTPAGEVSGPIEILNQLPNKSRTLIKMDLSSLGAGPMTVDQRFDGTSGYVVDTLQGNRDITGNQLENMKNGSFEEVAMLHNVAFDQQGNARGAMGIDTAWFRNSSAIGIAIAPLVGRFFSTPDVVPLFAATSTLTFISALAVTQMALLTRSMNFRSLELRAIFSTLVGTVPAVATIPVAA